MEPATAEEVGQIIGVKSYHKVAISEGCGWITSFLRKKETCEFSFFSICSVFERLLSLCQIKYARHYA